MHKFFNALAVISALSLLASRQSAWSQESQGFSPTELANRTIHRRAVDAAIWGLPTVSFDSLRQAYFRDAKAKYNDLIWWPKGSSWKNQMLTPNTSVRYVFLFCNTKSDGPVVLELPGAVESASFFGTIEDSWWMPLVDIGLGGKGGKYLILPPNYKGEVASGYIPVRPRTFNTFTIIRSILRSYSDEDVRKGDDLVKQIKVYSLSRAASPPQQRFIDMTDILCDSLIHYDENLYVSLHRMLDEETAVAELRPWNANHDHKVLIVCRTHFKSFSVFSTTGESTHKL